MWFRVTPFLRRQIPATFLILIIYMHTITLIVVRSVAEMSRGPNTHAFFCMALAALLMNYLALRGSEKKTEDLSSSAASDDTLNAYD